MNVRSLLVVAVVLLLLGQFAWEPALVVDEVRAQSTADDPPVEQWSRTYGGPRDDRATAVARLDDGYLVGGLTRSFGRGTTTRADLWLLELDGEGEERWARAYGSGSDEVVRDVLVPRDGGSLLVGGVGTAEGVQLYRLDTDGGVQWSRLYGVGTGVGGALETDDGYLLAGQRIAQTGSQPGVLFTLDTEGRLTDSRTFVGRRAAKERFTAIVRTSDSGLLLAGVSDRSEDDVDTWAVKLAADGEEEWNTVVALESREVETEAVVELPDGDFLLVGTQMRNNVAAGWAARLDATTGVVEWRRTYPDLSFADVVVDREGVLVAGTYRDGRATTTDAVLVALDERGDERWRQRYGGARSEAFAALTPTESGYLLVGRTNSEGAGRDDVYVVAVDYPIYTREFSVSADRVERGDDLTVSATVANGPDRRRNHEVRLFVDGELVESRPVVVPPNQTARVEFSHRFDEPGTYEVTVDTLDPAVVTVAEPPTPTPTPEPTPTATTEPTPTPEPTPSPTPTRTTETTSPGFGVFLGVVAVVVATLLLAARTRQR